MKYNNSKEIPHINVEPKAIKDTEVLLKEIKEATNIYSYISSNNTHLGKLLLPDLLKELMQKYKIKKTHLIYSSHLSRSYIYEVFTGKKIPSRNKLISIIIVLGVSVEEANKLLQSAGYQSLYPKDLRDAIILFGLQQKMPVHEVNDILFELNIELIN